jgi:hypothetical protein
MTRSPVLGIAFYICALASVASAETLKIRTLALRAGQLPEVYVKVGKGHQKLNFSAVQPTETVRARQASPLRLYKREKDADGKAAYIVGHKVKIPAGAKGVLLLGWSAGDKTHFLAIADDFGSAQFNDWLFINTSKRQIAFKCGNSKKPVMVAPLATVTHRMNKMKKGKGASVKAWAEFKGDSKLFYSTYWPVYPEKRLIVLFFDDGRKIHVKRISDKLAKAAKKPDL